MGGDDVLLAARLVAGDDRALVEAFDNLAPVVYWTALRVLGDTAGAQDVVQDTFVQLWRRPDCYNPALGSLRTYLSVLARNRAIDLVRSEVRRIGREDRHQRLAPEQRQPLPCEEVTSIMTADAVREAVRALPPDQRRVIELAYFEGLTYRDVAQSVGIPEGTAKSRLRLAMAKLETMLDRQMLEPS